MVSFLLHKCLQFASFPTTPAKNLKKFTKSTYDRGESAKTMQSRLASTTTRFNQMLLEQFRPRRLASTSVSPFRRTGTAHPTTTQQARRSSTGATTTPVEDVSCAGLDGTPWPEDIRKQEEDDKEYFKHHKASPLSAVEVVDTRKPITRATDGTVESYGIGEAGGGVIRWRPEQLDTAEEALRRAVEIWRQNVMRGDPDSPHGRVLRMLRGENW